MLARIGDLVMGLLRRVT